MYCGGRELPERADAGYASTVPLGAVSRPCSDCHQFKSYQWSSTQGLVVANAPHTDSKERLQLIFLSRKKMAIKTCTRLPFYILGQAARPRKILQIQTCDHDTAKMLQQKCYNHINYSKSRTTFQSSPDHAQHIQLMPTNKSKFNDYLSMHVLCSCSSLLALLFISQSPPTHVYITYNVQGQIYIIVAFKNNIIDGKNSNFQHTDKYCICHLSFDTCTSWPQKQMVINQPIQLGSEEYKSQIHIQT